MANVYIGKVTRNREYVVTKNGRRFSHRRSLRVRSHSPDGFCWGYGGSGPAQLALALLLSEGLSPEEAQRVYQDFKWAIIAGFAAEPGCTWQLTSEFILAWLTKHGAAHLVYLSEQANA